LKFECLVFVWCLYLVSWCFNLTPLLCSRTFYIQEEVVLLATWKSKCCCAEQFTPNARRMLWTIGQFRKLGSLMLIVARARTNSAGVSVLNAKARC
jgi:hypothetical protein